MGERDFSARDRHLCQVIRYRTAVAAPSRSMMHSNATELHMAANAQPLTAHSDQPTILPISDSDIKT